MLDQQTSDTTRISPGAHLKAEMSRLGLDQSELATKIGVTRQVINYAVNDRKPISRSLAASLGRFMGLPEDYWLRVDYLDQPAEEQEEPPQNKESLIEASGILVDFQIKDLVKRKQFEISPFDEALVKQASVDLTVGSIVIDLDGKPATLDEDSPFMLKPGQTINLETQQSIRLHSRFVGRVGPTTSLSRQGILTLHGLQVDPGYDGKLQFCLSNLGQSDFAVCIGDPCLSLEVVTLRLPPRNDFVDNQGDRSSTQSMLVQRNSETILYDVLKSYFLEEVSATPLTNGRFQSSIEGLAEHKSTYATSEASKQAFLQYLESMYGVILKGRRAPKLDEFRDKLLKFMEKTHLSEADATAILNRFGAKADDECLGFFEVPGQDEQVWVDLPGCEGQIALSDILEQIGALEVLSVKH